MRHETSTLPDDDGHIASQRSRWARRAIIGVLALWVTFGVVVLPRTRTLERTAVTDDLVVTVEAPRILRSGESSRLEAKIRTNRAGRVTMSLPRAYLAAFEPATPIPAPTTETTDEHDLTWSFDGESAAPIRSIQTELRVRATSAGHVEGDLRVAVGDRHVRLEINAWVIP